MSNSLKSRFVRKAAKSGAKHTAHGAASKLKRRPLRASALLLVGGAVGAVAGWLVARGSKASTSPA
jgi:ferric-dicitrate binding protein FerR (iron transport regulator)